MSFEARYRGRCDACDEPIEPGQEIEYVTVIERGVDASRLVHVTCPEAIEDKPTGAPCQRCTLHHPGEC